MSTVSACGDVEQEKARQRTIIDSLLGVQSSSGTSQQSTHSEHTSSSHALDERGRGVVDLKSLFSGQQFSFLTGEASQEEEGGEGEGEGEGEERADVGEAVTDGVESSDKRELFFFHWCDTDLANREDCSFSSSRQREEVERNWRTQRSAMRQLLRQSHRQAVRATRHGKRRHVLTISEYI